MNRIRSSLERRAVGSAWRLGEWLHRRGGGASRGGRSVDERVRSGHLDGRSRSRGHRPRDDGSAGGVDAAEPAAAGEANGAGESMGADEAIGFRPPVDVENPVLTATDVTDYGGPHFVADPFVIGDPEGLLHMFFEVFNRDRTPTAAIGHATSRDGGRRWAYDRIVLDEPDHLSFPYVFSHDGARYMLPDKWGTGRVGPVDLYRADTFPRRWSPAATIVDPDRPLHDCVVFRWRGRWWAIAGDGADLYVYYTDELERSDWHAHPRNPVVSGRSEAARPAGRPIVRPDGILLFLQDCASTYGRRVRAFLIETLTATRYADVEVAGSPVLEPAPGSIGWNSGRMHHIDLWYGADGWRCAVDGNVDLQAGVFGKYHWSIGMYEGSLPSPGGPPDAGGLSPAREHGTPVAARGSTDG